MFDITVVKLRHGKHDANSGEYHELCWSEAEEMLLI